jgi:hypothetical protein
MFDGASWTEWQDILVGANTATSSAIVLDDLVSNNYNQGIRINRSRGVWSGIVLGGKKGSTQNVDAVGYSATLTQEEGNGTWWLSQIPNGDFEIVQSAVDYPDFAGVALYAKRSGEVYVGRSKYPENVVGARLYGADLGVAPDSATAAARNEVCFVPSAKSFTLERSGNKVFLNGYLGVQSQYGGTPSTGSFLTGLKIPHEMLPLAGVKQYVMINATFDGTGSGAVRSRAVSCYLVCPASRVSGQTTPVYIRCEAITPGAYQEMFFDSAWFVD